MAAVCNQCGSCGALDCYFVMLPLPRHDSLIYFLCEVVSSVEFLTQVPIALKSSIVDKLGILHP